MKGRDEQVEIIFTEVKENLMPRHSFWCEKSQFVSVA